MSIVGGETTIIFTTPFEYSGENNLLVEIALKSTGNCPSASYLGTSSTGASWCSKKYQNQNFLPKVTFTYTAAAITCDKPTSPVVSSITSSGATLSWTAGSDEEKWNVQYKASSDADWTLVENITDDSYVLNLVPATSYQAKVAAVCKNESGLSGWTSFEAFETPCGIISVPTGGWTYGFESSTETGSGKIPRCWEAKYTGTYTKYPYVIANSYSSYSRSGNNCLYFYGGSSSSPHSIILPEFDADLKDLTFSFYYNNGTTDSDYPTLRIGYYSTDGDPSSTFVSYGSALELTDGYKLAEVDLKDIPTTVKHLVIYYADGDLGHAAYVDDIKLIRTPNCNKPSELTCTAVTANSATLSWTNGGSEEAWKIQYKADDASEWTEVAFTSAELVDGKYTLTGLSANTNYTAQVLADCGGGDLSDWNSTPATFKTACGAYATADLPFAEGFESIAAEAIPDCWTRIPDDNNVQVRVNGSYNTQKYARTGTKSLWLYGGTTGSYGARTIVFPEFEEDIANLTVEFYYKTTSTGASYGKPTVGYINTDGTFVGLKTFDQSGSSAYAFADFAFPASFEDTPANIAIQYAGGTYTYGGGNMYIDDITVKKTPDCVKPTNLACNATTANTATLSWTKGKNETAWKVQYSTSATFASDNVEVDANSNSAFELSGLTANTLYYVHVQAACESEYSDAISFRTDCETENAPWSEDFTDFANGSVPTCWDNSASTATMSYSGNGPVNWNVYSASGNNMIRMNNYNSASGTAVSVINTPTIQLPSDKEYELSFDCAHTATCGNLSVKISIDNGSTFTEIKSIAKISGGSNENATTVGTIENQIISLVSYKGQAVKFQFYAQTNAGYGIILIDNVAVRKATTCFAPTLAEASAITPDGATFSWTESGKGETQYQYICVPAGETPDWSAATLTSALTATVSGKAAGTYDFYVRSYCGTEDQSEAVSQSFTTATVPAPASVTVTGITNNSATASWTAPEVTYPVQYQWKTSQTGSVWSTPSSDLSAALSDLEANTEYTIYVRTYYSESLQSAEATQIFTTLCDPETVDAEHPFVENFNGLTTAGEIPSCWDNSEVPSGSISNANRKWSYYNGTGKYDGACVRFDSYYNGSGTSNVLATPQIVLSVDADLTFWVKNPKGGAYTVQISVDRGTRTPLVPSMTNVTDWTKYESPLTDYIGHNVQFFFVGTSNGDGGDAYLYLDDVQINPISCRKPATLNEATAITADGATLSWSEIGAGEYQYAVAEAGTDEEDLVWNYINTESVDLTGLQANTSYDFYVRTYCGEDNQSEARSVSFKTACGVYGLPFEQNFNAVTAYTIPECWDNEEGTLTEDYQRWRTDGYSIKFNSSTNEAGSYNVLATPAIQLGEDNLLSFKAMNPTGGALKVQIKEVGGEAADLMTEGLTNLADWTLKYVAIPAAYNNKQVQLLFHATSNAGDGNAYISIDNVRVARGEIFADGGSPESRLAALNGQTIDFIMERPMQFNGYYNTLCLPFDLSAAELADEDCPLYNNTVMVFDYAVVDNAAEMELQLAITAASGIQAGVPCFVKYDGAAAADRSKFLFKEVTISSSAAGYKEDNGVAYRGIFNPLTVNGDEYIFVGGGNQLYWPGVNRTMNNFRAYFYVQDNAGGSGAPIKRGMRARLVERAEVPTGIESVQPEAIGSQKVLENSQVVIIRNGVKYNMQGQEIR